MKISPAKTLCLTSPAFEFDGRIPPLYSAEGGAASPPLSWSGLPQGTKQLALVVIDPDAPTHEPFVHWVAYGIDPASDGLPEGGKAPVEGKNSAGGIGYTGPKPPPGHGAHRYYFWLYALDSELDLPAGLTRDELAKRIKDHVLEQSRLVGTFES